VLSAIENFSFIERGLPLTYFKSTAVEVGLDVHEKGLEKQEFINDTNQ
jgi:hypothetical protein